MDRDEAREKTRFLTKRSSFDDGTPKGKCLKAYKLRKEINSEKEINQKKL